MRGRKPKPTYLKIVEGNPGKRPLNEDEPIPEGDLFDAPIELLPRQRILWDMAIRVAPQGLLKNLDGSLLKVFVVAQSYHEEFNQKINTLGVAAPESYFNSMNKQAAIMMRCIAEMGFSPVSRSRVKVTGGKKSQGRFGALKDTPIADIPKR